MLPAKAKQDGADGGCGGGAYSSLKAAMMKKQRESVVLTSEESGGEEDAGAETRELRERFRTNSLSHRTNSLGGEDAPQRHTRYYACGSIYHVSDTCSAITVPRPQNAAFVTANESVALRPCPQCFLGVLGGGGSVR